MSELGKGGNTLGPKEGPIDGVFYESEAVVVQNYTVPTGKNSMAAGPVTIADGVTVTIPDGSTLTIV